MAVKVKMTRYREQVVEIFYSAIHAAQLDNGLEFFGNYSFFWISCNPWPSTRKQRRDFQILRGRHDGVAEADIDLHWYSGLGDECCRLDSDSAVLLIPADRLRVKFIDAEYESVVFYCCPADLAEDCCCRRS